MKIIGFLESASPWILHAVPHSIALSSKFRNKIRYCDDIKPSSFARKNPHHVCRFLSEISHNEAWMHIIRTLPCVSRQIYWKYSTCNIVHETMEFVTASFPPPQFTFSFHLATRSRETSCPDHPPMREQVHFSGFLIALDAANYDCPNFLWLTTIRSPPWHRDSPARRRR